MSNEPVREKTNNLGPNQVRYKPDCTGTDKRLEILEEFYNLCSENKGADQLRSYCEADLRLCFRLCRCWFSHAAAQMIHATDFLFISCQRITCYCTEAKIIKPTSSFFFLLIQFNVPFKIISAHMRRTNP